MDDKGRFTKGDERAGRKPGIPNRTTADVRAAIAKIAEGQVKHINAWLKRVAESDPGKALDLYIKLIEYHIPKLSRAEVTGAKGDPLRVEIIDPTRRGTA